MPSDWDWNGSDEKNSTVIRPVEAVAVYTNVAGDLVIRQQNAMGEEDSLIVLPLAAAPAVIAAIQKELDAE
jgi:hypothetical protein